MILCAKYSPNLCFITEHNTNSSNTVVHNLFSHHLISTNPIPSIGQSIDRRVKIHLLKWDTTTHAVKINIRYAAMQKETLLFQFLALTFMTYTVMTFTTP